MAIDKLEKLFPPWTVTRDPRLLADGSSAGCVWCGGGQMSRCQLVHKYRVYRGTFPHPALRGQVMNKLLGFVARAMAIAKLTDLHISIPASGSVTEAVPESCFPHVPLIPALASSHRVSFARKITVIGAAAESAAVREPTSLSPPALPELVPMDIQLHEPIYALFPEEDFMDDSTVAVKPDFSSLPAPPGCEKFTWPEANRGPGGIPSTFDFSADLPGWFPGAHVVPATCRLCRFRRFSVTPRMQRSPMSRTHLPGPLGSGTFCGCLLH